MSRYWLSVNLIIRFMAVSDEGLEMATLSLRDDDGNQKLFQLSGPGGKLRFGVGDERAERGSVWSVVANKNSSDVYIGNRDIMKLQKVSLHESGRWRLAWTDKGSDHIELPDGANRLISGWNRPKPMGNGWTLSFRVIVPSLFVTTLAPVPGNRSSTKSISWIPRPAKNSAIVFTVVMIDPDLGEVQVKGAHPMGALWLRSTDGRQHGCLVLAEKVDLDEASLEQMSQYRNEVRSKLGRLALRDSSNLRLCLFGTDNQAVKCFWDLSL